MRDERDPELDAPWVRQARDSLDRSVGEYDAATRHALREARERAVREAGSGWHARVRLLLWAGCAAAPAALAAFLLMAPPEVDVHPHEQVAIVDEVELYGDLEFYEWLAEESR